ncbi:MAG: hypothetical protein RLZZ543_2158 [Bacteroidota bacterium]|jgi:uncharacterized protein YqgV (UPF0045/DUF77 family)
MQASIDISLYPLDQEYKDIIIHFIHQIRANKEIYVSVNGLSTQLFGPYDTLFNVLQTELKTVLEQTPAVAVLKIASGTHTTEALPEILK